MVQGMVAWGRLLHSSPYLCRAWVFWREGVVVSVKGQVGSSLVFWVLGERGEKNGGGNASSSPVLCASRGRRRLMVPFKTTPFALYYYYYFAGTQKWVTTILIIQIKHIMIMNKLI
jgi:hypothetical protein